MHSRRREKRLWPSTCSTRKRSRVRRVDVCGFIRFSFFFMTRSHVCVVVCPVCSWTNSHASPDSWLALRCALALKLIIINMILSSDSSPWSFFLHTHHHDFIFILITIIITIITIESSAHHHNHDFYPLRCTRRPRELWRYPSFFHFP